MSHKRNPADQVVQFFETTPLPEASTILDIVRGVVSRRISSSPASVDAAPKKTRKAGRPRGSKNKPKAQPDMSSEFVKEP